QYATGERRADEIAAFTVILRFLAIEAVRHVDAVPGGKRGGSDGGERNALVGRTEDHVDGDAAADDGLRLPGAEARARGTGVEQAGIEEVRACASRFQREFAEAQHVALDGEGKKFLAEIAGLGSHLLTPVAVSERSGMIHAVFCLACVPS